MPDEPTSRGDPAGRPGRRHDRRIASPVGFGAADWRAIAGRVVAAIGGENLTLIAAGVGFYAVLALVPTLVALVSFYGFMADPADIRDQVRLLAPLLPESAYLLVRDLVTELATRDDEEAGWTSLISALIAVWTARAGVSALCTGLNIANREREGRGFFRELLVSYLLTFCLILVMAITMAAIVVMPAVVAITPGWDRSSEWLAVLLPWPLAVAAVVLAVGLLYRLGPSRRGASVRWLSPGAVLATVVWLVASLGFTFYVTTFADHQATYGALGAVVGLMLWFWLGSLIVLVGARVNAEMEFQTSVDTTTGPPKPIGRRGAFVADHVAGGGSGRGARRETVPAAAADGRAAGRGDSEPLAGGV